MIPVDGGWSTRRQMAVALRPVSKAPYASEAFRERILRLEAERAWAIQAFPSTPAAPAKKTTVVASNRRSPLLWRWLMHPMMTWDGHSHA